jgi:hydrogenase/urease accessory protein HupE
MIKQNEVVLLWVLLVTPGLAFAHSPIEGINNFYNGVLHPVFVPAHLLLILSLGLFFGQQGAVKRLAPLRLFVISTSIGLIVAWFVTGSGMELLLLSGAVVFGLLIAASPVMGNYWILVIVALAGFCLGVDSAQEAFSGKGRLVSLLGSGLGICLLLVSPMVFADYMSKKTWQKVGLRIAGSWLAASAFLILAVSFSSRS